jgi:hypothetical protein
MIFDPKIFFQSYQKDYHRIKSKYLKSMLDDLDKFENLIFEDGVRDEDRETLRRTLKSELRQNYFHAIETFFELFFAFNPKDKREFDDVNALFKLTNSNWTQTYKRISDIANDDTVLDFLFDEIEYEGYKVSIGNFLFYHGIFSRDKFPQISLDDINKSINAIKYGIILLAKDFTHREEYNAYKHGLRIIPAVAKLSFTDVKDPKVKLEWDLKDSMSFYLPTKNSNELTIVTKLFDVERDYLMTNMCSYMIYQMVFYRRIMMNFDGDAAKFNQIEVRFFDIVEIEKCNKVNVDVQDVIYTISRKI